MGESTDYSSYIGQIHSDLQRVEIRNSGFKSVAINYILLDALHRVRED